MLSTRICSGANPVTMWHKGHANNPLRKHAYSIILKISPPKTESFHIKILIFFTFLLKKIDRTSKLYRCFLDAEQHAQQLSGQMFDDNFVVLALNLKFSRFKNYNLLVSHWMGLTKIT